MKKYSMYIISIGVLIIAIYTYIMHNNNITKQEDDRQRACTSFIQQNITQLSPSDPVLGGTRYTTNIQYITGSTTAIVNYEDGHIAETISVECTQENNGVKIGEIIRLSSQ